MRRRPERIAARGFTLLELLAALSLAGLVFAGASHVLVQLADARDRLRRDTMSEAARVNGRRVLESIVYRAHASDDSTRRFTGSNSSADFTSLCRVPAGWLEECHVLLTITATADTASLQLIIDTQAAGRIWQGEGHAEFRFRDPTTAPGVWRTRWDDELITPAAIGIVFHGDTIVLPIGSRL